MYTGDWKSAYKTFFGDLAGLTQGGKRYGEDGKD